MAERSKEVTDFENAVEGLVAVAKALHTPFDTSEVERTAKALVKASGSVSGNVKVDPPKDDEQPKATPK